MTTSKSYRAELPNLGEGELQRLRTWAAANCSVSSVFREGEAVIWLAVVRPSFAPRALH